MNKSSFWCSLFAVLLTASAASADVLTYVPINNDADSGISAAKNYVYALDFGSGATANVNGVAFTQVPNAAALSSLAPGFTYQTNSGAVQFNGGNGNHNVTGSVTELFSDMVYNGNNVVNGNAVITNRGLIRGAEYEQRIYTRQWGANNNRSSNITFTDGFSSTPLVPTVLINEDDASANPPGLGSANQAYALTFNHTAETSRLVTDFQQLGSNQSWHLYGYTLELVSLGNSADYSPIEVYNTGVDANGNVLAAGSVDPHWTLIASPQDNIPPGAPVPATVATNNNAWSTNDPAGSPGSSWISAVDSGATNIAAGNYTYRTEFNLYGLDPGSALLELDVQSDNDIVDIVLNGQSTGITATPGFTNFTSLLIDSGFIDGINTLDIVVNNAGTTANPGGFRALISGSALNAPEPTSLLVWGGLGLAALVIRRRYRRR